MSVAVLTAKDTMRSATSGSATAARRTRSHACRAALLTASHKPDAVVTAHEPIRTATSAIVTATPFTAGHAVSITKSATALPRLTADLITHDAMFTAASG